MKRKFSALIGALGPVMASVVISPSLFAQESVGDMASKVKVTDFGFDYNGYMLYNDNKENQPLLDLIDEEAPATTILTGDFYARFSATVKKTSFDLYYNVAHPEEGLEVAFANTELMDGLSLGVGKNYINTGGFDNKMDVYDEVVASVYTDNYQPHGGTGINFAVSYSMKGLGDFTLQLVNDVRKGDPAEGGYAYHNEVPKQPGMVLEWMGDFGGIMPLVQIAPYDGVTHSMYFGVGVGFDMAGISGYLDFISDSREADNGAADATKDVYSNLNLKVAYAMGSLKPFIKLHAFSIEQEENIDGNVVAADAEGNLEGSFGENATIFAVGTELTGWGDQFRPYVALITKSQEICMDATCGETDTGRQTSVKVGIKGSL